MCPDRQPCAMVVPEADTVAGGMHLQPSEKSNLAEYLMTLPEALETERDTSPLRDIEFDYTEAKGVKQFQEKESLIAALKIIALGEKGRLQGSGMSVAESQAQLATARQRHK